MHYLDTSRSIRPASGVAGVFSAWGGQKIAVPYFSVIFVSEFM